MGNLSFEILVLAAQCLLFLQKMKIHEIEWLIQIKHLLENNTGK